jgi:hypothetical protein
MAGSGGEKQHQNPCLEPTLLNLLNRKSRVFTFLDRFLELQPPSLQIEFRHLTIRP